MVHDIFFGVDVPAPMEPGHALTLPIDGPMTRASALSALTHPEPWLVGSTMGRGLMVARVGGDRGRVWAFGRILCPADGAACELGLVGHACVVRENHDDPDAGAHISVLGRDQSHNVMSLPDISAVAPQVDEWVRDRHGWRWHRAWQSCLAPSSLMELARPVFQFRRTECLRTALDVVTYVADRVRLRTGNLEMIRHALAIVADHCDGRPTLGAAGMARTMSTIYEEHSSIPDGRLASAAGALLTSTRTDESDVTRMTTAVRSATLVSAEMLDGSLFNYQHMIASMCDVIRSRVSPVEILYGLQIAHPGPRN